MAHKWDGKSKGSVLGYRFFLFSIKMLGVKAAYLILKFVSIYYYLFAKKNRDAISTFYMEGLGFTPKKAKTLTRKNFYIFGQTLIDRVAFLVGKDKNFTYSFENENCLIDMKNGGRGGILLSAHLGNWETAGNLLKERVTSRINVVMIDEEVEKIKKYLDKRTGGSQFNIIPIKNDLSHIIGINMALERNELIAIHADRLLGGVKYFELDFLGKKAKFPMGPFVIAAKFNAPVSFVFAIKKDKQHYALSATIPITEKMKPEEVAKKYVAELEKKVKEFPEQWFNYYDYFRQ